MSRPGGARTPEPTSTEPDLREQASWMRDEGVLADARKRVE